MRDDSFFLNIKFSFSNNELASLILEDREWPAPVAHAYNPSD
jgi:hypothetical protein